MKRAHPITATEELGKTERGCVRNTSRSGSSEACVLGSFHRLCAFERAAVGPSDKAAVLWQCRPAETLGQKFVAWYWPT